MTTENLAAVSGLPIVIDLTSGRLSDPTGTVVWDGPGQRTFGDLRGVVATPESIGPIATRIAYLTYRDVRLATETGLPARGLRYDVTVTLPGSVGGEFVKTAGHYHALAPDGVAWPEIYDVLAGNAAFVLQHAADDPTGDPPVDRVLVVVAGPGDRLVIPPSYGHVTVNIGAGPLVVADLVAIASHNHYHGYATRRGAAVRILTPSTQIHPFSTTWNPTYPALPSGIEIIAATDLPPFAPNIPLYSLGTTAPDQVAFLTPPLSRAGAPTHSPGETSLR